MSEDFAIEDIQPATIGQERFALTCSIMAIAVTLIAAVLVSGWLLRSIALLLFVLNMAGSIWTAKLIDRRQRTIRSRGIAA